MAKMASDVAAPLIFRIEAASGGRFTWSLIDTAGGTVLATGGSYERRRDAKQAIRLVAQHARHAQMEDHS